MPSANLEQKTHLHRVSNLITSMVHYVSKACCPYLTDEMLVSRERRSFVQGYTDGKSHSQAWSPGQIRCSFYYIIGCSHHIFRLWNWLHFPPGSSSTNSCNKIGFCLSESRALCCHPAANAILLSPGPHRNRWGENAERSSSSSCCPDPHELWCSKGKNEKVAVRLQSIKLPSGRKETIYYLAIPTEDMRQLPKLYFALRNWTVSKAKFTNSFVSWPTDKGSLLEIRQLIDVLHAWRRQQGSPEESNGDG